MSVVGENHLGTMMSGLYVGRTTYLPYLRVGDDV